MQGLIDVAFDSEGRPLLTGDLHNRQGAVVASFGDQGIDVPTTIGCDVNWDHAAYEVVDDLRHPVFQAELVGDPPCLVVHAYAYRRLSTQGVGMFVCDQGLEDWVPVKDGTRLQARRKTIFRYPGFENPGVRAR
ncbi:MAG: hypothetical protein HY076_04445 [Candidatus Eisenbacteria bacterium]|uniref:Uncharacterized protein n=1 Tax=Eiseniibacteriota bacterium TaxID=2212470 RepID=A0A9D6LB98_UNCEI|nr:hypothetical protein [Candidatus Eisenbacteria bacterium]MBI3539504.1 hypothetical protein [Candidatus Eisenbacteria bacterium]